MARIHPLPPNIELKITGEDPILRQETEEWRRLEDVVKSQMPVGSRSPEDDNLFRIVRGLCKAASSLDERKHQHVSMHELISCLTNGGVYGVDSDIVMTRANAREPGTGKSLLHVAAHGGVVPLVALLLDCGAAIDARDASGRTPMHYAVARSFNHTVKILLQRGASYTTLTNEGQTVIHFAARYDADKILGVILAFVTMQEPSSNTNLANVGLHKQPQSADDLSSAALKLLHQKDAKGRSPLHVAAMYDRSVAARYLLELGADASEHDSLKVTPLETMIDKMPGVAKLALASEAFVIINRTGRKMTLDLAALEPPPPATQDEARHTSSPLEQMVLQNRLELIDMPAVQRLIYYKWIHFGRHKMLQEVAFYFVYLALWTTVALSAPESERHIYSNGREWRAVVEVCAMLMWAYNIFIELMEIYRSYHQHKIWVRRRISELSEEQAGCDADWPDHEYLSEEIQAVRAKGVFGNYVSNAWNYFDWMSYLTIFASFIANVDNITEQNTESARQNVRWMTVALIFMWAKVLKLARAFETFGPFVVMLGKIVWNVVEFVFLYVTFLIPFVVGFYLVVGDSAPGDFGEIQIALMSVYRMTFVDYDYDEIYAADQIMGPILVASWLFLSGVLMVNLFVAIMSNTFQIVYDNAKSVAAMQHADAVLSVQYVIPLDKLQAHRRHIHAECNPDVVLFDEDDGGSENPRDQLRNLREEIYGVVVSQTETITQMSRQLDELKTLMQMMQSGGTLQQPQFGSRTGSVVNVSDYTYGQSSYLHGPGSAIALPTGADDPSSNPSVPTMLAASGRGSQLPPLTKDRPTE